MATNWGAELTIGQRLVAEKAKTKAIALCNAVISADDHVLAAALDTIMGARPNESRTKAAKNFFKRVRNALTNLNINNFRVKQGAFYAEVLPDNARWITVADDFWTADRKGQDSTAGVLIHEASHWTVVRGTDDHAYGDEITSLSYTLSQNNADTWERIAESFDV